MTDPCFSCAHSPLFSLPVPNLQRSTEVLCMRDLGPIGTLSGESRRLDTAYLVQKNDLNRHFLVRSYRTVPSDLYQGASISRLVMMEGGKKSFLVQEQTPYGIGLGDSFSTAFKKGEYTEYITHDTFHEDALAKQAIGL